MFDDNIAPIPKPDVDFSSLSAQPTPEQYFLLSRIDGELTVAELCRVSGLSKDETLAELGQLVEYGLIDMPASSGETGAEEPEEPEEPAERPEQTEHGEQPEEVAPSADDGEAAFSREHSFAAESAPEDVSEVSDAETTGEDSHAAAIVEDPEKGSEAAASEAFDASTDALAEQDAASSSSAASASSAANEKKSKKKKDVTPNFPVPPSEFEFDQDLLALDIPLDDEQRRQALCLYEQIDQMTFYDLFGVEPDASRRDIKRAYFRLSKRYHPDKFFRKELHDFAEVLERVFQEITKAYRILSNRNKREEYDATLESSNAREQSARSPAEASSLAEHSSRAFQDEENEEKKRKKNKKAAAALLLVRRAKKLVERGEYERAASEYRKALALKREPEMAIRVARMLEGEGERPDEAISFARAALKLDPRNLEARVLLSELYEKTGRGDDAMKHLEKAARLDPSNQDIQDRLTAMRAEQS